MIGPVFIHDLNIRNPTTVISVSSKVESSSLNSYTMKELDHLKQNEDLAYKSISKLEQDKLESNIEYLYEQRQEYIEERNKILSNLLKRLFFKKRLAFLDSIVEDIDYQIYLIESESTKATIESAKKFLEHEKEFDSKNNKPI